MGVTPAKTILCDGVLWVGDKLVPGVAEAIDTLQSMDVTPYVVTNNPTSTRHAVSARLMAKCFHNVPDEMIVSPGCVTAQYLLSIGFDDPSRRVFIAREDGLIREMKQNGIAALGVNDFGDVELSELEIPEDIAGR
jgi:ribonucleotide monophosphatase NagD (HAD superfamily)